MRKVKNENKLWILGSLFSIILLPTIFIAGIALGAFYQGSMSLSQDNLSSWVTALATVSIAVLTLVLAKETWNLRNIQLNQIEQIRKDAIRPAVDFIIKTNPASMMLMDVCISNTGSGTAHNIKFSIEGYNPVKIEIYESVEKNLLKLNILKNGILSLGVNEKRTSFVFDFNELTRDYENTDLFQTTFTINISYNDIEGENFSSVAKLDFSEFLGISEIGEEPLNAMASSMKKIEGELKNLSKGMSFKRFEVNSYDSADRKKENKLAKERREVQIKKMEEMKQNKS